MTFISTRSASQIAEDLETLIFIVYESHEVALADALKQLFEHWRIGTFYCRQEIRGLAVSTPYRRFLADELSKARLVIPLLSPSFQWSPYCQAEAGACTTLNKPMIPVLIPPSTVDDVRRLSPVLEGLDAVVVAPGLSHWGTDKLLKVLQSRNKTDKWEANKFIDLLQSKILQALGLELRGLNPQDAEEARLRSSVEAALKWVIEDNLLSVPNRESLYIWPSIDDSTGSFGPASIVENIKRSLTNADLPTTALRFVGVSLKFSLRLITVALNELAADHKKGLRTVSVNQDGSKKILQITLVHMGDQAHILHALHDQIDIENILTSFHEEWSTTLKDWGTACHEMGVDIEPPKGYCIDYIPPRIGIMIDNSILYAGRCSFPKKGETAFHLRAGENEYFFYNRTSVRGRREIDEFEEYLAVYRRPSFYGVTLVPDANRWIGELEHCVVRYPETETITLISQTCSKFEPLVKAALIRGLIANIYVQHPDSHLAPDDAKASIRSLPGRIRKMVQDRLDCASQGVANIYYYRHSPTYRAASIGKEILGVQMYISRSTEVGTVTAGELRLVLARHSSKYSEVHRELIDQFKNYEGVSREPDIRISVAQ